MNNDSSDSNINPAAKPDTITVAATAEEEVAATHAAVSVSVRGLSLFTGNAALTKAREVAQLVADLSRVGVAESQIELRAVHADVTTGALGNKSSAAVYSLRVNDVALAAVADVIGAIAGQKNTTLRGITWRYGNAETLQDRLLQTALSRVQARARLTAAAFGVTLRAVHAMTEVYADGEEKGAQFKDDYEGIQALMRVRSRSQVTDAELGLEVMHSKRVTQTVSVVYRVSAFGAG